MGECHLAFLGGCSTWRVPFGTRCIYYQPCRRAVCRSNGWRCRRARATTESRARFLNFAPLERTAWSSVYRCPPHQVVSFPTWVQHAGTSWTGARRPSLTSLATPQRDPVHVDVLRVIELVDPSWSALRRLDQPDMERLDDGEELIEGVRRLVRLDAGSRSKPGNRGGRRGAGGRRFGSYSSACPL